MTDELKGRVLKLLRNYRLTMTEDGEGNGYLLVDAVTPPGDATIERGIEELEYLAEDLSGNQLIDELSAKVAALEADAMRYRWIRDAGATFYTDIDTPDEQRHHCCEFAMDAAIDAALTKEQNDRELVEGILK